MTIFDEDAFGVPAFARIEIALRDPSELPEIARDLRDLANDLEAAASGERTIALLLAYRKIRAHSAKLRGSN